MGTSIEFDLNAALRQWREALSRSPHVRTENLDELESHLRDSVVVLQSKGLAADEAFLIGTRRVGSAAALEPEFAKENGGRGWRDNLRRFMNRYANKAIHGLIVLYFALGCWFLWGILEVSKMVAIRLQGRLPAPAFTRLFFGLMPFWYFLPAVAALYCLFVWARKNDGRKSWFGFFAITTAVLVLLAFPTLIAAGLTVVDYINRQAAAK